LLVHEDFFVARCVIAAFPILGNTQDRRKAADLISGIETDTGPARGLLKSLIARGKLPNFKRKFHSKMTKTRLSFCVEDSKFIEYKSMIFGYEGMAIWP
jgi:hypothetical protein